MSKIKLYKSEVSKRVVLGSLRRTYRNDPFGGMVVKETLIGVELVGKNGSKPRLCYKNSWQMQNFKEVKEDMIIQFKGDILDPFRGRDWPNSHQESFISMFKFESGLNLLFTYDKNSSDYIHYFDIDEKTMKSITTRDFKMYAKNKKDRIIEGELTLKFVNNE